MTAGALVIIGGHGKVALHLTKILTKGGHQVSSVIRNPDHAADVEAAGATAVVARTGPGVAFRKPEEST